MQLSNGSFSSIQTLIIKDITFLECQGGNEFVMSTPDGNNRTFSGIKFQDCSSDSMLLDIGQNGSSLALENFEFVGCTGVITTRYGNWESLSVVDCSTNSYFFFSANINNASFESNVFGTSAFDGSVTIQSTSFTNNSSSDNFDLDSSILNLQSGQIVNCTFRGNAGSGATAFITAEAVTYLLRGVLLRTTLLNFFPSNLQ